MTKDSVLQLESWFVANKEDPYQTRIMKNKLARETNLTYEKVSIWFKKRRLKHTTTTKRSFNRLSFEQKILLNDYFTNCHMNPSKINIEILKKTTKLDEKKIRNWFAYRRFKIKRLNL